MITQKVGTHLKSRWYVYVIVLLFVFMGSIINRVGQQELYGQEASIIFSKGLTKKSATDQVTMYYKTCLGRSPEKKGLDFHVNLLTSGKNSLSQVKAGICGGAEAQKYIESQIKKQNPKIGVNDLKKVTLATIAAVPIAVNPSFTLPTAIAVGISKIFGISRPKWYPKEAWKF